MYLPAVGTDTVASVMGMVTRRLANDKEPYKVVVRTEEDRKALCAAIAEYKQDSEFAKVLAAYDSGNFPNQLVKGKSRKFADKTVLMKSMQLAAKHDVKIEVNDLDKTLSKLDHSTTKLYVVGHGVSGGGGDGVYVNNQGGDLLKISSTALTEQLKQGDLPLNFQDVRLDICYGADKPSPDGKSTGQLFANALGEAGFNAVQVAAYPGAVLKAPRIFDDGKLHGAVIPEGRTRPEIASRQRQVFLPEGLSPKDKPVQQADTAASDGTAKD